VGAYISRVNDEWLTIVHVQRPPFDIHEDFGESLEGEVVGIIANILVYVGIVLGIQNMCQSILGYLGHLPLVLTKC
jgi:hypothetical protein